MMEDTGTDGTIIVGIAIFMVMKCTPENGKRKTKENYEAKFSIHTAVYSSLRTP